MFNFGFLLESGGSGFATFAILGVLILFFVFMSRSQKKRDRADQQMRDSLQVGDEVTTIGGIIGKVVSIKAETFVLETTKDKTKIRFLKGAIRSVDVKAQDVAAQIMDAKAQASKDEHEKAPKEAAAPKQEKAEKKKRGKKHREAAENAENK